MVKVQNPELVDLFAEIARSYDEQTVWQVHTKVQTLLADRLQEASIEAKHKERFDILNKIQTMSLDISSESIVNGRVNIMPFIAKRLQEELPHGR